MAKYTRGPAMTIALMLAAMGLLLAEGLQHANALKNLNALLTNTMAVLLFLVLMPYVGRSVNGAQRWINLGPVNLQPSELMKIALILAAVFGAADGFFQPAFGGIVPLVVEQPMLPSANSWIGVARNGSVQPASPRRNRAIGSVNPWRICS